MTWDDDKLLISAISTVNPDLGYYALRLVDIDAGRAEELAPVDEAALGARVMGIGSRIRLRASRRRDVAVRPVVHCRDVLNRPQQIGISLADGQIRLSCVPAETARLTKPDAEWLVELLHSSLIQLRE